MLTAAGLNKIASSIKDMISVGTYRIGSIVKEIPIYKITLTNNVLQIQLYLDDSVQGLITQYQLKSSDGTIIAERPDSVQKSSTKGLLIIFNISIKEV